MQTTSKPTSITNVAIASFIGTSIEWYDFYLYGTAAALILGPLFFSPKLSLLAAQLAAFATFWIGFVARPIGGMFFGHFGDRLGRKTILILTLGIMGASTFLIGCLPTYQSIGVSAPLLLIILRFAQGFAIGGEWGGAVLMTTEHAPKIRRGFYSSWPQMGAPIGLLISSLVFTFFSLTLSKQAFMAFGWRIPFLITIVLVGVGLFVRLNIAETPDFEHIKARREIEKVPLFTVLRTSYKTVILATGALFVIYGAFYIFTTFILSYGTTLKIPSSTTLSGTLLGAIVMAIVIPLAAILSDRIGRLPVYLAGAAFVGVITVPAFWLITTRSPVFINLAIVLGMGGAGILFGPQAAIFSELFAANVRYSGVSFSYQVASMFSGGLTPIIATALLARYGGASFPIALYLVGLAVISFVCVALIGETRQAESVEIGAPVKALKQR